MGWGIPTLSIKHMHKVEIQVERVEIKSHPRKLKGDWKIEIDPEPIILYYYPPLWDLESYFECLWKGKKELDTR